MSIILQRVFTGKINDSCCAKNNQRLLEEKTRSKSLIALHIQVSFVDPVTKKCPLGQVVRYWLPVTNWENGFMFQISDTVIWNWMAGDVYQIPFGIGHCSGNAGYIPQYTVSLTGILND